MTLIPCCLAWRSEALTASAFVRIRMPLSPREMAFWTALIWLCVSPSCLPAATVRDTLSFFAAAAASLCIWTKYGLVRVLRISVTPTRLPVLTPLPALLLVAPPPPGALDGLLPPDELQAVAVRATPTAAAASGSRRRRELAGMSRSDIGSSFRRGRTRHADPGGGGLRCAGSRVLRVSGTLTTPDRQSKGLRKGLRNDLLTVSP